MTEDKRFGFECFEISKTDRFLDEVKLYEIDKNYSDDLDESDLFYVYSDSEENIIQLVDKLNGLVEENIKQQTRVKKVLKKQLDYYTERALLLNQAYGDVTEAIYNIADELGVDLCNDDYSGDGNIDI